MEREQNEEEQMKNKVAVFILSKEWVNFPLSNNQRDPIHSLLDR